ncbi:MAG: imidazole glycerol phosphate synthase subunit HisF [Candidatus Bathyarchaeia archaeon]
MLAKRIIPCLDFAGGYVVKGVMFKNLRVAGDPVELAELYSSEGADEIVFLDISATEQERGTSLDFVRRAANVLSVPFTVGGGIRTLEDARSVLLSGADKTSINTGSVKDPRIITALSKEFGSQCVVVAIDAKRNNEIPHKGDVKIFGPEDSKFWFEVYIRSGKLPTGIDAVYWARRAEELGAGEILLTSIDKDGTGSGYDLELIRAICENVNIPVIASGGCGEPEHMYEAFMAGADAALAASIFHFRKYSIREVKEYLVRRGITIRL